MRPTEIWRSTALRAALLTAALSLLAFVLVGAVAFGLMQRELLHEQDQALRETFAVFANAYEHEDGRRDFTDTLRAYMRAAPHRQRLFRARSAQGRVLAGNFTPQHALSDGWLSVPGTALGLNTDTHYRLLTGRVHDLTLTVGASQHSIDALETFASQGFALALLFLALIALGGGGWLGVRAQRRLDAIGRTMDRVAAGDLAARVPRSGRGDDIDRLAAQLNQALDRLQATVEGIRQVSVDIAHDLKTPLGRLKIRLLDAQERQARGEKTVEALDAALAQADQLNTTFEALLRIARLEGGAREARFACVDLHEVAATLHEIYAEVAADGGMTLETAYRATQAASVRGDRELLVQLGANLIENALRHCPAGTRIELAVETEGDGVALVVRDDGPGIPAAERERVLRRFYRLDKSRTRPGSGLGLSLVKAIAGFHGARLALEDARPGLRVSVLFFADTCSADTCAADARGPSALYP
ncbi:sensor histidine kinase [Acidihalobacter ferrooxydans]|uniref:histidine kinase n=1 Tax=Acidihalobacter ferrooxydans TaxID=1765967 RepID=A0A1P8UEZ2_9GAMM|nr:HAMP domain-containing sensor histidine kinase [Acidihalobacter ferrooxydans]APZ42405.1 hypothetical protein BW247_04305 [Acidihalobacter ferrooxydans]